MHLSLSHRLDTKLDQRVGGPSMSFNAMSSMTPEEMEELADEMTQYAKFGCLRRQTGSVNGNLCDSGFFGVSADAIQERSKDRLPSYHIGNDLSITHNTSDVRARICEIFTSLKRSEPVKKVEIFSSRFMNEFDWIASTREKIMQHTVECQKDFLLHPYNPLLLHDLKQQDLADHVQCHVTTISRLLNGIMVQFPDTVIRELSLLIPGTRLIGLQGRYVVGLFAQDERYYDEHDGWKISDEKIADELKKFGVSVQRRAVGNYRQWVQNYLLKKRRDADNEEFSSIREE